MGHTNKFKQKILESKNFRKEVVKYLVKNLEALDYLSKKLLRDKEIITEFNTDTAILALKAASNIQNVCDKLGVLNDTALTEIIDKHVKEARYIISSIYNIENDIYTKQKEHHQLLRQYDREFHMLTQQDIHTDKIQEIKLAFKNELQAYKDKVKLLENTYNDRREELGKSLKSVTEKNEVIQQMLENYKRKELDTKKLYIKEFVYA